MNRNKMACDCRHVSYGRIEDAIRAGADSFDKVQAVTGCGKACGKCQEFIRYLVDDILRDLAEESR